jgi:hypothetical protein
MEVHSHSHVQHTKKWKDYLFEFLMLFLAITIGFFVENQREHYVERKREIIYVKGVLYDLTIDTANFSRFIVNTTENVSRMDSLIKKLRTYKRGDSTAELYYLARTLFGKIDRLQYNSRTYDQLKSSGSLRLIHSQKVLDFVSNYFESLQWVNLQNILQLERQTQYGLGLGEIFDAWTMDSVFNSNFKKPISAPPLLTVEKRELNRFIIRLHLLKGVVIFTMKKTANEYFPNSKNLILLIKKEYDIE